MSESLLVAAAQTVPVRGMIEANLAHHVDMVRAAAAKGVGLVVFPELSLTGYELDLMADLAFEAEDPRLDSLRGYAEEGGITVVVGAPLRLATGLHIGAFVLVADGSLEMYTKHHLGGDEPDYAVRGDHRVLIDCDGSKAAVAICADANRPSHAEAAAALGADLYLTSAFVTGTDQERKEATLSERAARHSMIVLLANFGGPSGGMGTGGRSAIWDRSGRVRARGPREGAALVIAPADGHDCGGEVLLFPGAPQP